MLGSHWLCLQLLSWHLQSISGRDLGRWGTLTRAVSVKMLDKKMSVQSQSGSKNWLRLISHLRVSTGQKWIDHALGKCNSVTLSPVANHAVYIIPYSLILFVVKLQMQKYIRIPSVCEYPDQWSPAHVLRITHNFQVIFAWPLAPCNSVWRISLKWLN
jgi:hypothetical protein